MQNTSAESSQVVETLEAGGVDSTSKSRKRLHGPGTNEYERSTTEQYGSCPTPKKRGMDKVNILVRSIRSLGLTSNSMIYHRLLHLTMVPIVPENLTNRGHPLLLHALIQLSKKNTAIPSRLPRPEEYIIRAWRHHHPCATQDMENKRIKMVTSRPSRAQITLESTTTAALDRRT